MQRLHDSGLPHAVECGVADKACGRVPGGTEGQAATEATVEGDGRIWRNDDRGAANEVVLVELHPRGDDAARGGDRIVRDVARRGASTPTRYRASDGRDAHALSARAQR